MPHTSSDVVNKRIAGVKEPVTDQEEQLSADVLAFCSLIARILMRVLSEHDEQVLEKLFNSNTKKVPPTGGILHDTAA